MPRTGKIIGLLLIFIGLTAWYWTGSSNFTLIIPALFGLIFFGLGFLSEKSPDLRSHALRASLLLAIFGVFSAFGGLAGVFRALAGTPVLNPISTYTQALMAILCLYVLITIGRTVIRNTLESPDTKDR